MHNNGSTSRNTLVVPIDNLLLFMNNPGCVPTGAHPDRRSMYRWVTLLRNFHDVKVGNTICISHITLQNQRVHHIPDDKNQTPYFRVPNYMCRLMAGLTAEEGPLRLRNTYIMFCSPIMDRILRMFKQKYRSGSSMPRSLPSDTAMVDDIVRCWWESVGMPTVLQHRGTARLVRRALRLSKHDAA